MAETDPLPLGRKPEVVYSGDCPSRRVFRNVTRSWTVLVLVVLLDGTMRYSDFKRRIGGISERMLALSLKSLEADGFVKRVSYPVVPPHVEYSLTPLGRGLAEKMASLVTWLEGNFPEIQQAQRAHEAGQKSKAGNR